MAGTKAGANGEADARARKRAFVITPIGGPGSPERLHADWVLNAAIKPVFEAKDYEVFRSDTIADPAMINDAIFNHVTDDEICVADLSFLNPNVFYELGVRHALLKPVIHIAHDAIRLPFDTAQHRAIFFNLADYHSVESLKKQLADQLDAIETDGFKVSNPLTHAKGRQELANSGDSRDMVVDELISRVENLESELRYGGVSDSERLALGLAPLDIAGFRNWTRKIVYPHTLPGGERHPSIVQAITQFMVDRESAPLDEIVADFPREFGAQLGVMSRSEKDQLHDLIMRPPGAEGMIDGDLLRKLIG